MRVIFLVPREYSDPDEDEPEAELDVIPRVGETVYLDTDKCRRAEFAVQTITHYPCGSARPGGAHVDVELRLVRPRLS